MKSKRMVLILVAMLAVFALAAAQQHSGHGGQPPQKTSEAAPAPRKVLYWYDAMNPSHHYDKPGKAPDGMDLVPQYAEEQEAAGSGAPGAVKISGQMQQLIGVRTGRVEREALSRDIHATAVLTTDETQIAHVHVKVNGWIDQVFVDFVGQRVRKGQPLFTLYSPDLVATQQEYLIALRGKKELGTSSVEGVAEGSESLLRAARERLRLWDISDEQVRKLEETGEVSRTLTFYSPVEGFVLDRKAFPQAAVTPDMDLYTVADLSTLWADAAIYEYEAPYVRVGQSATVRLSYQPGKSYSGRISYIYPTVDPQTRTVKVRMALPNPRLELKPQMFAEVELKVDYGRQLVVPQEAVLDSGQQQTVFVAEPGGHFTPRVVTLGARVDGRVIVLSGLREGESIVTSGNFLIDSESRLKSAMGGMQH